MSVLALAALLLAVVGSAAAAPDAAFALCVNDDACALRWGLYAAEDEAFQRARFDEMVTRWEVRDQFALDELATAMGSGGGGADVVLLAMMRAAAVCAANEEWVLGVGCQCMAGRHCADECVQAVLSDLWSLWVAVCIFGVVGLLVVAWLTHQDRELARRLDAEVHEAAVAYYTAQAVLYVARTHTERRV